MQFLNGGICFITGPHPHLTFIEQARIVLNAGIKWVQLRDKDANRRQIYCKALLIKRLTDKYNAALTINDHPDIALAVDAYGVHLGQDDFPLPDAKRIMRGKGIGISTHDLYEAQKAQEGGADYIGFGPIFETKTKDAGAPKGIPLLKEIRKEIHIPIVAIGGIRPENLRDIFATGANAVAVSGAILEGDFAANAKSFVRELERLK
jgi:thiamine-phosphate pyrophosphorylase